LDDEVNVSALSPAGRATIALYFMELSLNDLCTLSEKDIETIRFPNEN
jgi:hypothetical protein